ncbi:MAG: caspase family protein [Amaricoccus sp.]
MKRRFIAGAAILLAATLPIVGQPAMAQTGSGWNSPLDLTARAPKRFGVVIGNGEYRNVPGLRNAHADADLVAGFLEDAGYEVSEYRDLTKLGFEQMMRRLLLDVDKDSEVVLYYAGHGVQIAGGNYLIPVDAEFSTAYDVPFEAISLTSVVDIIGARARLQVVVLDSCRDNPFGDTLVTTDLSKGLSETRGGFNVLTAPINSLLAFSTSPGALAYDGSGANSPFAEALVETARQNPDRPLGEVFEQVRRLVFERTEGRQVPWESSTLVQPASFAPPAAPGAAPTGGDEGAGSATRSLILVTMPDAIPAATPAPATGATAPAVALTAPLARQVGIGKSLAAALHVPPDAAVTLAAEPKQGRLVLTAADGTREDAARTPLTGASLVRLAYVSEADPQSGATAPDPVVVDSFALAAAGAPPAEVQLSLQADPCDREAGDQLDPEGVGLGRFANEIEPEAALAACRKSVQAQPDVGRFHYQLGRAELALRQFDAAQAEFAKARDLGHTRAYVALGNLAASQAARTGGKGDAAAPEAALSLWQAGVDRGDPFAFYSLGKQLLRYGGTDAEREHGFDLLTRSLELGHTFAMNELGAYFLDPNSPHTDPARGLRYLQESAARGDIYGYNNLGLVYLNGEAGVTKDPKAALDWFTRAANGGHPLAPGNIGRLWNSGALGSTGQFAQAVQWDDLGLARGDAWAGANAAWIIANRSVPGLGPRDAAVRAAKAAALRNPEAAAEARTILAGLPPDAVNGAAQELVNALGGQVAIDGSFGPATAAEMQRVLAAAGAPAPASDAPLDRLLALAGAYWTEQKFRVDLY